MKIHIRPSDDDDRAFVIDSWARSFGHFVPSVPPPEIARHTWYRMHRAGIRDVLHNSRVQLIIAVHPEAPETIMGWACWEPPGKFPLQLHYVLVKDYARRQGVGSALLEAALANVDARGYRESHRTPPGRALLRMRTRIDGTTEK